MAVSGLGLTISACTHVKPLGDDEGTAETGQVTANLRQVDGAHEYIVAMSLDVLNGDTVVTTVETDENDASINLELPVGPSYGLDIQGVNPDMNAQLPPSSVSGPYCTYEGPRPGFQGCTFTGYSPNPILVSAGDEVEVTMSFNFRFADGQIVPVTFGTGQLVIGIGANVSIDPDACGYFEEGDAGAFVGEACDNGETCLIVQNADPNIPRCYMNCETNADCNGNNDPVEGSTRCGLADTFGGDGRSGGAPGLESPPQVCQPEVDFDGPDADTDAGAGGSGGSGGSGGAGGSDAGGTDAGSGDTDAGIDDAGLPPNDSGIPPDDAGDDAGTDDGGALPSLDGGAIDAGGSSDASVSTMSVSH
jgi:hypothetical protein